MRTSELNGGQPISLPVRCITAIHDFGIRRRQRFVELKSVCVAPTFAHVCRISAAVSPAATIASIIVRWSLPNITSVMSLRVYQLRFISWVLLVFVAISCSAFASSPGLQFTQSTDGTIFAVFNSGACPIGLNPSQVSTPKATIGGNRVEISSDSAVSSYFGSGPCDPELWPGFMIPVLLGKLPNGHYVVDWSFYPSQISGTFDVAAGSLVTMNQSITNPSGVSGLWYDPVYSGSGFDFKILESGLLVTYFGWDAAGNRLWLMSDIGPKVLEWNTPVVINMNYTVGGVFTNPQDNVVQWGSLTLNFSTCEAAIASLAGKDGVQNLSLRLLAGIAGQSGCQ